MTRKAFCVRRTLLALFGSIATLGSCVAVASEAYPNRPIRIIVPFSAGGSVDIIARGMSQWLGEKLNTPVVVENRPGANGMIGTRAVSGADPDGYTLLFGYDGTLAIAPAIMEGSSFDPLAELAPVIRVVNATLVAASPTTLPVRSFEELIAYAKDHKVTYGTSGIGSTPHMFAEQMKLRAGLDWTHVPYKGGSAATADAVGGQISAVITAVASVLPFVKSGLTDSLVCRR